MAPGIVEREYERAQRAVMHELCLERWPDVPVKWNRRLRRAGRAIIEVPGGRFQSATIELSPAYFEVYPDDLYGILVHEIVHVALAMVGRPFGHGPEFKQITTAAGGLLHGRWLPGRVLRYRCPVCRDVLERRRRATGDRWCASCAQNAREAGIDPFTRERALVLVGTGWQGPERDARCVRESDAQLAGDTAEENRGSAADPAQVTC